MKKVLFLTAIVAATSMVAFAQTKITVYEDCEKMGGSHDIRPTTDPDDKAPDAVEWIDLGLPSGVLWANMNAGAIAVTSYGSYFAWGETSAKTNFTEGTYKWCNSSTSYLTKYCNNSAQGYNGYKDAKTKLDITDDAAQIYWGGNWRIPTKTEWEELIANCSTTWGKQNNSTYGIFFISRGNGNKIFLPAACYYNGTNKISPSSSYYYVYYWSSTLYTSNCAFAYAFNASSGSSSKSLSTFNRYLGLSIRPVRDR